MNIYSIIDFILIMSIVIVLYIMGVSLLLNSDIKENAKKIDRIETRLDTDYEAKTAT